MVIWLQISSDKNKASWGKQKDIARHEAKSLAQPSDKMVTNKLRIHEYIHDT